MTLESAMLVLEGFAFSLDAKSDTPYQSLRRRLTTGFKPVKRLANFPTQQLLSLETEKLTISGAWYMPKVNENIVKLRQVIYSGKPLLLTDFKGNSYGRFVLLSYDEQHKALLKDGRPQEVAFTMELERHYE